MANTKIPVELSSTPSIVDNGDATAITITSDEKVGIGTTSPSYMLTVKSSNNNHFRMENGSEIGVLFLDSDGDMSIWAHGDDNIKFLNGTGSGTERMRITSAGNVGIGTSSPAAKLEAQETTGTVYAGRFFHGSNPSSSPPQGVRIDFAHTPNNGTSEFLKCRDTLNGTPVNRAVIMSNGGFGNFPANDFGYSDERMKKDISNATAQLDNLKKLKLKTYRYKEQEASDPTNLGVVAQDIQTDFPDLITEQGEGDEARLGVREQQIMWMAVKAIQEQQDIIEDLQQQINEVKNGN